MKALTIDILLIIFMFFSLFLIFFERIKNEKGIGARTIQLVTIVIIIPLIIILLIEKIVDEQLLITLLSVIIGYILSSFVDNNKNDSKM